MAWALDDLLPKARPLPFHGRLGPGRHLAFTGLPSELLTAARHALGARKTSNTAVLLTAIAGALRESGLTGSPACAMVPVDVRTADQPTLLGNHYATVRLPLPAHPDPGRRLAALEHRIRRTDLRQRALFQADLVAARPRRVTAFGTAAGRYVDSPTTSPSSAPASPPRPVPPPPSTPPASPPPPSSRPSAPPTHSPSP